MPATTWFTAFAPYAITIACTPGTWPPGAGGSLLTRDGDEPAIVRRLRERPARRGRAASHVLISLLGARSVLGRLAVFEAGEGAPPVDDDHGNWDVIEEGAVLFSDSAPEVGVVRGSLEVSEGYDEPAVAPGWHRIRVRCMGLHPQSYNTMIHVDVWPIDGPGAHTVITSRDATYAPPEARAGRERDVAELWPRLRTALREAGVAAHPALDLDPARDTSPPVWEVMAASLEPDAPRGVEALNTDLSAWFEIVSTNPTARLEGLVPGYDVVRLDEALRLRTMMIEAWDIGEITSYPDTAGRSAYTFIPEYVPIADLDGYLLVADMRTGPLMGQIRAFDKVDADDETPTWLSIGDLLLDLIVAIETGGQFDGWDLDVVEGRPVWSLPA